MTTYNGYKLPKVASEISDLVTTADAKSVKEKIKEDKCRIEDYLVEMLRKTEEEINIYWHEIFKVTATYYDNWTMPVLGIYGMASEKNNHYEFCFFEVFTNEAQGSVYHNYTRAS